jgi:quercetin dioxygenase-like cupin family protein
MERTATFVAVTGLLSLTLVGCSSDSSGAGSTPSATPSESAKVVATVFGQATPPNAPGQVLTQYAVTIPPGAAIAAHEHPGQQIGRITAGELTYTIDKGTLTIFEGTSTPGQQVASRTVTGPTTITLTAGTTIAEADGMVHNAKNNGSTPVEITLSILTPQGDPLSVPKLTPTPSASAS